MIELNILFKILGALGIGFIIIGIFSKNRKILNKYYIIGGVLLLAYSLYIKDILFIILQIVFIFAVFYDFSKR